MKETRIVKKIQEQGGTTYVTAAGSYIKKTGRSFSVYDGDPRGRHSSIHFNVLSDGSLRIKENGVEVIVPASMFK